MKRRRGRLLIFPFCSRSCGVGMKEPGPALYLTLTTARPPRWRARLCLIGQASRGRYRRSRSEKCLSPASVTLHVLVHTWIPICTDTHVRAQRGSFELARGLPHPHPRPSRRACLCQQMSGRRCVFLCLSLRSFHLLLQRLPICLWPRFISSHSSPPHTHPPHPCSPPTNAPEDRSGSVVFQTLWHCLFQQHNPAFQPMLLPPQRRTRSHRQKVSQKSRQTRSPPHLRLPAVARPKPATS